MFNIANIARAMENHIKSEQNFLYEEQEKQAKNHMRHTQTVSKSAPKGYGEEFLNKVENVYREYARKGREFGWSGAADNLEYFLNNSGKDKILSSQEVRKNDFIKDGEEFNRQRFVNSLSSKNGLGSQLLKLAPGHEKRLNDHWDYKIGYLPLGAVVKDGNFSRSHLLSGNVDEILATGDSFLKSYGDFKAKRTGNTVFVDGIVTHRWDDIYDFEPMKLLADGALSLKQHGRAKNYNIKS